MLFFTPPNWLLRLFYMVFGEPDTTKAVKSINKALTKVQKSEEYQAAKAKGMRLAAIAADAAADVAEAEAARATRVAKNLRDIFEIKED